MNRMRTLILLSVLTALLLFAGRLLGGSTGFVIALVLAGAMNLGMYWFSDKLVLRMHRAQELGPGEAPGLHEAVQRLAAAAGIPKPRLFLIPDDAPNAFATGRNPSKGIVAVTEGLLRGLSRDEVEAVIAHEIAHIRNRDTLVMTAAATVGGALSMLAEMAFWGSLFGGSQSDEEEGGSNPLAGLAGLILAPIAAMLIQMAISRTREYMADEGAARYTGDPMALARALRKIERWSQQIPMESGRPATAHLYIQNPFTGGGLARLFSTHPATEQRIERLQRVAAKMGRLAA